MASIGWSHHLDADDLIHVFGPRSFGDPAWMRRYNPARDDFSLTPQGWRIDYRGGAEAEPMQTGGFKSRFRIAGKFTVTMRYQLQRAETPTDGEGAGMLMRIRFGDGRSRITMGHVRQSDTKVIMFVRGNADGQTIDETFPASLGRSAMKLTHLGEGAFAFEGQSGVQPSRAQWTGQLPVTDAGAIDLWATTGDTNAVLRADVQSVSVVADELPVGQVSVPEKSFPWWSVTLVAAIVALVGWFLNARRHPH
jgi:hypothetical protein